MGKLFQHATSADALYKAWITIRSNGLASSSYDTRAAVEFFEQNASSNIRSMCRSLRKEEFKFDPQLGIAKPKSSGGVRGIVMASVRNRVVERSILNTLQSKVPFVRDVIAKPTSIGGVPDRSVPHGLKIIRDAFARGEKYFARSDVKGFFDNVPRLQVIAQLSPHLADDTLVALLINATAVSLENETNLKEDRKAFPTDDQGVAQGSPLSPLFGNLLLAKFDDQLNGQGITCVRFIDDFILLGAKQANVAKAFASAKRMLSELGLTCHDPYADKSNPEKGAHGHASSGFVFLGYSIEPGLFQPSPKSRSKLLAAVETHLRVGRRHISNVIKAKNAWDSEQRYAQTLVGVDRAVRGWGNAFAYSNAPSTFMGLDDKIEEKLRHFRQWFRGRYNALDDKQRRRVGGVGLLEDITPKDPDDAPFRYGAKSRFRDARDTVTISTDGSSLAGKKRKDPGPGGWAFVVHGTGVERAGGSERATNNEMELRAIYEAVTYVPEGGSVKIFSDSRYVVDTINKDGLVKRNTLLWRQTREAISKRRVKVIWVRAHNGDEHNEKADKLANEAMRKAKETRDKQSS